MLDDDLLNRIADLHSGPDRGYHGWSHPLALLALWDEVQDRLDDPLAVRCAILLHDAIYEPRAGDNETAKARFTRLLESDPPQQIRDILVAQLEKLGAPGKPAEHIAVYGKHNRMRLTGRHETASIDQYTYGVALEATLTWDCNQPVTCLRCLAKGP